MSSNILSFGDSSSFMLFEDRLKAAIRKFGPEGVRDRIKASWKLQDLAWHAWVGVGLRNCRTGCRDTKHFHARPGAFIEAQKPETRALLKNLKSADIANVVPPPISRLGSEDNPLCGVLTWSAPTTWKLS
jgi:hypothetical protein